GDRQDISKQTVLSFQVNVLPDPEEKERLERVYRALEDEINRAFPDAQVCLFLVGDKLVLTGQVKDAVEATKILQIVQANVQQTRRRREQQQEGRNRGALGAATGVSPQNIPVLRVDPGVAITDEGAQAGVGLTDYILRSELDVINMLRIPGEQQVMLKVIVAEVNRTAARSIGLDFAITNNRGVPVFVSNTSGTFTNTNGTLTNVNTATGQAGNLSLGNALNQLNANMLAVLNNGKIPLAIQALRTNDLARSLAEPNLVTLNGRPATFRAGGEFPVPVVTGATNVGVQGVSFVPFGVTVA